MSSDQKLQELKQRVDSYRHSEYEKNFTAFRSVITEENVILDVACKEIVAHLKKFSNLKPYRICSLGCGNGKLDKKILQRLIEECPNVEFEYVGLDNDEDSLTTARSTFNDMSFARVDYHDLEGDVPILSKFPTRFDAVIAVHLMCYLKPKVPWLPNFVALLNPSGVLFAIHSAVDDPLGKLTKIFKSGHKKVCYMLPKDDVLSCLAQMKEKGEIDNYKSIDYAANFEKQKFYQNDETCDRVLNFITHVLLETYPRDIKDLCLKYLDDVHKETSGEMIKINSFTLWKK